MCVDIFAPGHPITIEFLHERLYFVSDHGTLQAFECCDAYIHNDEPNGNKAIEVLRIQIPHDIGLKPDGSSKISVNVVSPFATETRWYGTFSPDPDGSDDVIHDPDMDDTTQKFQARQLDGTFEQPPGTGSRSDYAHCMEQLGYLVLDFRLAVPIPPGQCGLLRLEVRPTKWPVVTPVPEAALFGTASAFMSRVTINSPKLLRDDLRARLVEFKYDHLKARLVGDGWRKPGTLLRIIDHRVSLVFPSSVRLSHLVTSMVPKPLFTVEPHYIRPDNDPHPRAQPAPPAPLQRKPGSRFVQGFRAGSDWNEDIDLVRTIERIAEYIATLPDQPQQIGSLTAPDSHHPRPMIDLVSKFSGGPKQEHLGTLLRLMVTHGFLKEVTSPPAGTTAFGLKPDDMRLYLPAESPADRNAAVIKLRTAYTFPEATDLTKDEQKYLKTFWDLHPFQISFTANWDAPSEEQLKARQRLAQLVGSEPELHNFCHPVLKPVPRRAVVVVCPECKHPSLKTYPGLRDLGLQLKHVLSVLGQFEVTHVDDPKTDDEILNAVSQTLRQFRSAEGGFLLWFLGHGQRNLDDPPELELFHNNSGTEGLRWTSIVSRLNINPKLPKVVVLNCCEAGLARKRLPQNTGLWTVCDENAVTPVATGTGAENCFTRHFCNALLEGLPADKERDPLPLLRVLTAAQAQLDPRAQAQLDLPDTKTNLAPWWKTEGHDPAEFPQFTHNLFRYDVLPPALRTQLREQVVRGMRGGG
ncbi:MAG TPA: hypothetical protein VGE74_19890 [Gemmata sp.]